MSSGKAIVYRYVGGGAHLSGVPARDLTPEEYAAIPREYLPAAETIYRATRRAAPEPPPSSD